MTLISMLSGDSQLEHLLLALAESAHPVESPGALAGKDAAAEAEHEQTAQHYAEDGWPPASRASMSCVINLEQHGRFIVVKCLKGVDTGAECNLKLTSGMARNVFEPGCKTTALT